MSRDHLEPPRQPGSVRRTVILDVLWRDGWDGALTIVGTARDLYTGTGDPVVVAEGSLTARVARDNTLLEIEAPTASQEDLRGLVGRRAGIRGYLREHEPMARREGSPLFQLLDDLSGVLVIAGYGLTHWLDHLGLEVASDPARRRSMVDRCVGLRAGGPGVNKDGTARWAQSTTAVQEVGSRRDPWSWHDVVPVAGMSMRRARRIDVWADGGEIRVDSMFQDSTTRPVGPRIAIHEYEISASLGGDPRRLESLAATARTLPYVECPSAATRLDRLVGQKAASLRTETVRQLPGVQGCTHLNDGVRALADVPVLEGHIRR